MLHQLVRGHCSGMQGKTTPKPPAATGPLISGASHPLQVQLWRPHL